MEIIPLGDSALQLRVRESFERDPEGALRAVLDLQRRLQLADIPGVVECAPAYESLGVFFNLAQLADAGAPPNNIFAWLETQITAALGQSLPADPRHSKGVLAEIPVCYESEFALDLKQVACHVGLAPLEVVRRHSDANYCVHCVGFTPGFPYLGGLPPELATPRRSAPRKVIPAGSVAIGGVQTGVYPTESPGGWNIIGRTPLPLFDAHREPPALLSVGTRVRFRAITRAEFDASLLP